MMGQGNSVCGAEQQTVKPLEEAVLSLEKVAQASMALSVRVYEVVGRVLGMAPLTEENQKEAAPDAQLDRIVLATREINGNLQRIAEEIDRL